MRRYGLIGLTYGLSGGWRDDTIINTFHPDYTTIVNDVPWVDLLSGTLWLLRPVFSNNYYAVQGDTIDARLANREWVAIGSPTQTPPTNAQIGLFLHRNGLAALSYDWGSSVVDNTIIASLKPHYDPVANPSVVPPPEPSHATLLDRLVGHWKLDDAVVTNGSHLVSANGACDFVVGADDLQTVSGKFGNAISKAPGTLGCISTPLLELISDVSDGFTVGMWINLPPASAYNYLVVRNSLNGVIRMDDGDTYATLQVALHSFVEGPGLLQVPFNTWCLLLYWYDPAMSTYYASINNGTPISVVDSAIAAQWDYGLYSHLGGLGAIDSLSYWNRLLGDDEKVALYNSGAGFDYPFTGTISPPVVPPVIPPVVPPVIPPAVPPVDPGGFSYSGPWPMQLENGFFDQCDTKYGNLGIDWIVDTKDYDLGMPDQEKRFVDFVVDSDTQGVSVMLEASFDSADYDPIGLVQATGRERIILPVLLGEGESKLATRCQLRLRSTTFIGSTSTTKLYKVSHRILVEPIPHKTHVTEWSDYGTPGSKFLRELWVEVDTYGKAVTIEIHVDGSVVQVFDDIVAEGKQRLYRAILPDIRGKVIRLKFIPAPGKLIKVYSHDIRFMPEPPEIENVQTPWSDEGAPNMRKRYRKMVVEVDNVGPSGLTVDVQIDNKSVNTVSTGINVTERGRSEYVFSFEPDTVGVIWRVLVTANDAGSTFRFYRAWVEAIPEPFQEWRYESPWTNNGTNQEKKLRDLVVEADTVGDDVVVTMWVDGAALGTTYTVNTIKRERVVFSLPVDTIGKLVRITATGDRPFTIYNHEFVHFDDSIEDTIVETPWNDQGAPNLKKRFRKLVVEVDNLGPGAITVDAQIDNATMTTIPTTITTLGRTEHVFSFEPDSLGILWRVVLTSAPGSQMRFWRAWVEAIPEPFEERRFESPWVNNGTDNEKRLRDLVIEADTGGRNVTVTAWVDGFDLPDTFLLNTAERMKKVFSLPVDLVGKITRITATSGYWFTIYNHEFLHFNDAIEDTIIETPWSDEGAPNQKKRFRKLMVEVNNLGPGAVTVEVQIDNATVATTPATITTIGRSEYVFSFDPDTVGILWRAVLRSAAGSQMRFWRAWVEAIPEPFHEWRYESPWVNNGTDSEKRLRDLVVEADTEGENVEITAWVDGVALPDVFWLNTDYRTRTVFSLPVDLIGKITRITGAAYQKFTIYGHEFVHFNDAIEDTIIETPWSDEGAPNQRKRFRKLMVEVNNLGPGDITVEAQVDQHSIVVSPTIIPASIGDTGRTVYLFSFEPDTVGILWRAILRSETGSQMRFWRAWVEAIQEPFQEYRYESPWEDIGSGVGHKRLRDLIVDCDTVGRDVTVSVWVDGAVLPGTYTINSNPTAPGYILRKEIVFSLPVDTQGKIARITATALTPFTIYRKTFVPFDDAIEDTIIETPWSDNGAPNQRKRFRKLLVEVNNLGLGGIEVEAQIDQHSILISPAVIPANIVDFGRTVYSFSFEPDTVGILWRTILRSETGSQMRFWRAWVEAIPEPFQEYRHESPWTDQGVANQKRLRDVIIEADTGGQDVVVTVWIDGYTLPDTYTLNTSARSRVVFSLPIDTIGKIMRLTATSSYPFTIYEHDFKYFEDSIEETIIEMPWVIEEWPYKKLWKEVVVQADTGGQPATMTFWLDGVITAQTFTFAHAGRLLSTFSLAKDTIGKIARVTFSAKIMRNYSISYVIDKLPPDVTLADTWTQTLSYDRYKILRRLWISMTNPDADVNFEIWIDNVLKHSGVILADPTPDPSFSKRKIDLPSAKKGKLFRLSFNSTSAFGIFWEKSEIELKDLNVEDGYRRERMAPPQTY
jgi:hypothetical protein